MNLDNLTTTTLRLEQVSLYTKLKTQQGYPILQDISFEALQGSRIAIVGPSGAGKTFLLRLINRLSEPSSGKIYLGNQEYRQIPVLKLRASITLVAQESKLLGMTGKDALAYPLILRRLSKQEIQQRLTYWIEKLQIDEDLLGRTEVQLSSGQKQLIAIARALVIQPKILLLDEPTSALDAGKAEFIMQVLIQVAETEQTTILMVNHQMEQAQMFCTRLLHLQQGRLLTNQAASEVDWANLQQTIKQTEKQINEEWS